MKMYFFRGIKMAFLFLLISKFQLVYPFEEVKTIDVRALSLGQMKALSHGLVNPAYLPFSERKQIGVSVINRFEMKELSTRSVFGLFPNRLLDMNFHLSVFGYDEYQLIEGQTGFAKKLSQKFSIGTSVGYLVKNSILEESVQTYLQADVGFFWQMNETFEWALTTENFLHTRNSQPVFCFTGVKYQLTPTACILLESGFDFQNRLFSVSAGFEYEIVNQFTVRGGVRNSLQMPSLGFAYKIEHWTIETAFLFHSALGISCGISAGYCF
jgi:hypothetical protein